MSDSRSVPNTWRTSESATRARSMSIEQLCGGHVHDPAPGARIGVPRAPRSESGGDCRRLQVINQFWCRGRGCHSRGGEQRHRPRERLGERNKASHLLFLRDGEGHQQHMDHHTAKGRTTEPEEGRWQAHTPLFGQGAYTYPSRRIKRGTAAAYPSSRQPFLR